MLKIIAFNGGLGNQMFQYAFYLALKEKQPLNAYLFDLELSQLCHNGYELDKVFSISSCKQAKKYKRFQNHLPIIFSLFHTIKQMDSLKYDLSLLSISSPFVRYEGFWQSEKYFQNISNEVRSTFSFNTSLLNKRTLETKKTIENGNYVAVHVRRGDYLSQLDSFGFCGLEYYHRAIDLIRDRVYNPKFVFLSDDMVWVKNNIHEENAVYVDWNHGTESWQDMYLMTQCKHNIIANSSFSWWGAWLNSNPNKMVIAPQQWFPDRDNYDIIPNSWIKL